MMSTTIGWHGIKHLEIYLGEINCGGQAENIWKTDKITLRFLKFTPILRGSLDHENMNVGITGLA